MFKLGMPDCRYKAVISIVTNTYKHAHVRIVEKNMWIILFAMLWTIDIYKQECYGINFIDLPGFGSEAASESDNNMRAEQSRSSEELSSQEAVFNVDQAAASEREFNEQELLIGRRGVYPPVKTTQTTPTTTTSSRSSKPDSRRHWLVSASAIETTPLVYRDDKDENIKNKINMLVQQTMHDTELKMKSVHDLKEKYRDKPSYRVGFILSMIKKSRDVLNELFNVAVKHRDEWKALEQLKIFELIVHTNVDTTNLVRQLVEIHIVNLNAKTDKGEGAGEEQHDIINRRNKVVLL